MNALEEHTLIEVVRRINRKLYLCSAEQRAFGAPDLTDIHPGLSIDKKSALLSIFTSKIWVGDPYDLGSMKLLEEKLPPMVSAVVYALMADGPEIWGKRVAATIINANLSYVIHEIDPQLELAKFKDGETAFHVDRATGCYMDERTYKAAIKDEKYPRLINRAFEMMHFQDYRYKQKKIVGFSTGMGDGTYSSYWVRNTGGEMLALISDFQVLQRLDSIR